MKSPVWRHFYRSKAKTHGRCNYCSAIIRTLGGTTTAMMVHLRTKHGADMGMTSSSSAHYKSSEGSHFWSLDCIFQMARRTDEIPDDDFEDASHLKSEVWKHFMRSMKRTHAMCKYCHAILGTYNSNTSTLQRHYRTFHLPGFKKNVDKYLKESSQKD